MQLNVKTHRLNKIKNKSQTNIYALIKTWCGVPTIWSVFVIMEFNLEGNRRKKKTIKIDERTADTLHNYNTLVT